MKTVRIKTVAKLITCNPSCLKVYLFLAEKHEENEEILLFKWYIKDIVEALKLKDRTIHSCIGELYKNGLLYKTPNEFGKLYNGIYKLLK